MTRKPDPEIQSQLAAFGLSVSAARKRAGMSQSKLCAGHKIDRAALSLLEKAHRSPDFPTLLRVCRALEAAPAELMRSVQADGARVKVPRNGKVAGKPARCFGENLKWARGHAGVSQEGVAYEAKVDRAAISLYESGAREPNLRTVLKLARALKLHPAVLLQDVR